MDTSTPDAPTPPAPPDTGRPTVLSSLVKILIAILIIIPGLCFGIATPQGWIGWEMLLALFWVATLLVTLIVGFVWLVQRASR